MPWIDFEIPIGEDEPTECEKQQVNDFACRKAKPRFYADENFPESAIAILRKFKADVFGGFSAGKSRLRNRSRKKMDGLYATIDSQRNTRQRDGSRYNHTLGARHGA